MWVLPAGAVAPAATFVPVARNRRMPDRHGHGRWISAQTEGQPALLLGCLLCACAGTGSSAVQLPGAFGTVERKQSFDFFYFFPFFGIPRLFPTSDYQIERGLTIRVNREPFQFSFSVNFFT